MNITRDNYESFFLLYVDNELSPESRAAVEAFVRLHPDLAAELDQLKQLTLQPDSATRFPGRDLLIKPEDPVLAITPSNCEEFFVLYADNELNNEEKAAVENFVYHHPGFQSAFEWIQQTSFSPDSSVVFPGKEKLYRREPGNRVIALRWWMAAAAIVLLLVGFFWLNPGTQVKETAGNTREAFKAPATTTSPAAPATAETNLKNRAVENTPATQQNIGNRYTPNGQPAVRSMQTARLAKTGNSTRNPQEKTSGTGYPKETDEAKTAGNAVELPAIMPRNDAAPTAIAAAGDAVASIGAPLGKPQAKPAPVAAEQTTLSYEIPDSNDKIAILNTEVNKPGNLKGLLRKASRFIAKKTSRNGNENRGGIHIGGFEIAVR